MKQILGKNKDKMGYNEDNFMNIELSSDSCLIPKDIITDTLDSYNEYLVEKDSSDKYRLIFTINPICTNILFNANTEIVYKEGSDECKFVSVENTKNQDLFDIQSFHSYDIDYKERGKGIEAISRNEMIQDTGYSHPNAGGFVYHCGADIFNNHHLRKKGFLVINKLLKDSASDYKKYFNTIKDYLRDKDGNIVKEKILKIVGIDSLNTTPYELHQYQYSTIKSFHEAIQDNLIESNGWVGFINPSSLNIPNFNGYTINKCMNNNKAGEQIDMYPDRSLYSFVPKYNKYRNRIEKNWDYCLTYPYENAYNSLVENSFFGHENGIKCTIESDLRNTIFDNINGDTSGLIFLKSQLKNTFTEGSFINISFIDTVNKKIVRTDEPIQVESIGYMNEDTMHYFAIDLRYIVTALSQLVTINEDGSYNSIITTEGKLKDDIELRVRKVIGGVDCKYYLRKFRRLPNFKHSDVFADDVITEEEIKKYSDVEHDFANTLNKLAFCENAFSDNLAQIVYEDDILTSGLRDNLGRPLTEVYLTIVKRNAGYKEWYYDKNYTDSAIEFSHCFGRVTSGVDLDSDEINFNIHKIHNIEEPPFNIQKSGICIENDIKIENEWFIGDIVEFSPYEVSEVTIEDVYHRFNTVQREIRHDEEFGKILYDEITYDDYDISQTFFVKQNLLGNRENYNLAPEGYYYKPHYKVLLREFEDTVNRGEHRRISIVEWRRDVDTYYCKTDIPYYFSVGDYIYFYDKESKEKYTGKVEKILGLTEIDIAISLPKAIEKYYVYKHNPAMPEVAYDMEDGTGRYAWREIKKTVNVLPGDETYNSFFANGSTYYHKNITFYLRRQDPYKTHGLNTEYTIDYITGASECASKDITNAEYIEEGRGEIC